MNNTSINTTLISIKTVGPKKQTLKIDVDIKFEDIFLGKDNVDGAPEGVEYFLFTIDERCAFPESPVIINLAFLKIYKLCNNDLVKKEFTLLDLHEERIELIR